MIISLIVLFAITILVALITSIIVATYLLNTFTKNMKELDEIQAEMINELIKDE